jgi:hypothetical protein
LYFRGKKVLIGRRGFPTQRRIGIKKKLHAREKVHRHGIKVFDEGDMEGVKNGALSVVP